ncbi:transcription factor MYBS3-like [Oryza sativa Japonica Group]|uniref:Myb transcription factor n=3 Tax=Oryza TaxID=4527 RepID=Q6ZDM0_ORYSJ|nr:transcription factor MYBS3-like [Oryza sativa Japonica Group]KAB8107376.1 hypothetical protein EE612_042080 [Oryza sativa]ACF60470.1 myb transcription factor [Oryza sativa Japonica Group]EAZ41494.1 hypothetical protein OsJ_26018 [Oryza sativa Japonica Group]KAF2918052.1 hypothetical protein DAI22_08g029100 [Oryza sativa Japonica Group]BAD17030.1 putative D13F protein, MybSt1 [Oryza sativa Japonica Group]|eukprot:NP_001060982.1 Os08g0144000 [Oryza sativa Japonica Group]
MTRDGALPASGGGGAAEGPRRCSQCGHHGHNARTCTARGPVKLFGVRIGDKPPTAAAGGGGGMRKSASMGSLAQLAEGGGGGGGREEGYGSDGNDDKRRKRGEAWSEEEHKKFLLGLSKLGKGDWRGISRNYVGSRTPTQVASHAQKYFIRQTNVHRRKRRSSLFDMVIDDSDDQPLSRTSSQEVEVEENLEDGHPVTAPVIPPAPVPMLSSSLVPPPVPAMAPVAPGPVLTSASATLPVSAVAPQTDEKEQVASGSNTTETGAAIPEVMPPYGYPMMLPPYYPPAFVPMPYYGYVPVFYAPPGAVQAQHEVVKPVAVHSKPPVHIDELYSMSELSLKGEAGVKNGTPNSLLPPRPIGRPDRQSAFHGKGPSDGSSNGLIPAK